MFENEKSEDYMGMIRWSKISCSSPQAMFGTEIKTDHPIKILISHAVENRELNHNWYCPHKKIIEVEMSPVQWAEFLTSGNTSGVPCTLKEIEGKRMSEPKFDNVFDVYNKEVEEHLDKTTDDIKEISEALNSFIKSEKLTAKNVKTLESFKSMLDKVQMNLSSNMDYMKACFKDDMSNVVMKAKAEFNTYVESRIHEIGIETIKSDSVKFLENEEK